MTAATGTARLVSRSSIVLNEDAWPRRELDKERVQLFSELYAHDADTVPPVELFIYQEPGKDGKQKPVYLLVDGWHRVEARKKLHLANVPAIIRTDLKTLDDAFMEACRHSAQASKPLTSKEKRAAVRRILKTHPGVSDREIARAVGCSHHTVAKMRHPLGNLTTRLGDALSGDGASTSSSDGPAQKYIEDRLVALLDRADADELTSEDLADALGDDSDRWDMARRWAEVMVDTVVPEDAAGQPQTVSPPAR